MSMELQDKKKGKKDFSFKGLLKILKYSFEGLAYFYKHERSAIIHILSALVLIVGGIIINMNAMEWLIVVLLLLSTLSTELLNTSIEAVCDLVSPEYNPLVKIAKDTGSAATFVLSLALFIATALIYIPKIVSLF